MMKKQEKQQKTIRNYSKIMLVIFYCLCITFVLFLCSFLVFLFTLSSIFGIFSFILVLLVFLEFLLFFRQQRNEPLDELLKYHTLRKDLLFEKNILLKQFFKRLIDPTSFEESLNRIESELLNIDYKIHSYDLQGVSKTDEIKERIKLLNKKYMKHEISQNLFEKLSSELNTELLYLTEKKE